MANFTVEAWFKCVAFNLKRTIRYGSIPFLAIGIAIFHASLSPESYNKQFVVFHMLHSFSLNVSSFKLMIGNMTKTEFSPIGIEHLIQVMPAVIHMLGKNKLERAAIELLTCYICTALLFVVFYLHMALLTHQFLARNPDKGLVLIPSAKVSKSN